MRSAARGGHDEHERDRGQQRVLPEHDLDRREVEREPAPEQRVGAPEGRAGGDEDDAGSGQQAAAGAAAPGLKNAAGRAGATLGPTDRLAQTGQARVGPAAALSTALHASARSALPKNSAMTFEAFLRIEAAPSEAGRPVTS